MNPQECINQFKIWLDDIESNDMESLAYSSGDREIVAMMAWEVCWRKRQKEIDILNEVIKGLNLTSVQPTLCGGGGGGGAGGIVGATFDDSLRMVGATYVENPSRGSTCSCPLIRKVTC